MCRLLTASALLLSVTLFIAGCGRAGSGPTYAEALQVYQNEQAELERIKKKRDTFRDEIQGKLKQSEALTNYLSPEEREKSLEETKPVRDEIQEGFSKAMKRYDEDIAKQEDRVVRARKAKNEAEAIGR